MKVITINQPNQYIDAIDAMVNLGFFPSRSEAVRVAIKQFLSREGELNQGLNLENFTELKALQMRAMIG